jgi:4-hydroxythreonine-4-phosphate dehydrogenase
MGFVGKSFNVVLATGHIPVSHISQAVNEPALLGALNAAKQMQSLLPKSQGKRPIALLGLNPHSGDGGLIGKEEVELFPRVLEGAKSLGIEVLGPLVPDAAFNEKNWRRFSTYVACYHDQGLIPFKTVHGFNSGVHLTLGLPIKRTSVDHGTAKDIFGKNIANPNSMIEAIRWAIDWPDSK